MQTNDNSCQVCKHPREYHSQVCLEKDCSCLCFLPYKGIPGRDEDEPVASWQENVIFTVLNLILDEQEGEVHVRTGDGRECHVKVKLVPEIGYTIIGIGKS